MSKMLAIKPIETVIPEINVMPTNNDEIINVFKSSILSLQREISLMNSNFNKLFSIMQDNNNLIQQQIGYQKELFSMRSEEHTSELQSLMRISYAVFCLKKKTKNKKHKQNKIHKKHKIT